MFVLVFSAFNAAAQESTCSVFIENYKEPAVDPNNSSIITFLPLVVNTYDGMVNGCGTIPESELRKIRAEQKLWKLKYYFSDSYKLGEIYKYVKLEKPFFKSVN